MAEEILRVENLTVTYGEKKIVAGVTFTVERGKILVIVGKSGCGKSTILKAIDGILDGGKIFSGQIFFCGKDITNLSASDRQKISGAEIGMVFQNCGASFCPVRKIGTQIFESVQVHKDWSREEFLIRSKNILQSLGLEENILNEYPANLSGGMAQRAGIFAAMILQPKLLLCDEPTSALDTITQLEVAKEILKLRDEQKISIVLVTHNLSLAKFLADEILTVAKR